MSTMPKSTVKSMFASPFDWCDIPAGEVILGAIFDEDTRAEEPTQKVKVPRFSIAKYPITNAQFARFIESGGYQQRKYWTTAGWKSHESGIRYFQEQPITTGKAWTQPLFWDDEQWNGADYPVVGISWYEAFAFCQWLSEVSGANISLPTEAQWQRAAQGDETYIDQLGHGRSYPGDTLGRAYPWGNDWDASRCNHNVNHQGIGKTTPVQHYEGKGDSPFAVVDMAGNVWEWCLTNWRTGTSLRGNNRSEGDQWRVLRGGSWMDGVTGVESRWVFKAMSATVWFLADYRNAGTPDYASKDIGFRIVYDERDAQSTKTRQKSRPKEAQKLPNRPATKSGVALPDSPVKAILPAPFDWCEIPAGKVLIRARRSRPKAGDAVEIATFYIAKYPITNAQFALFIEAGGYTNPQWWTAEGWKARTEDVRWDNVALAFQPSGNAWTEPPLWQDARFNGADQPVASISWHEAIAYCTWLSATSGETVTLPTLEQWQRAAQGDDGRAYPWGSTWNADFCNNNMGDKQTWTGTTTPVQHYEGKGDSPFGVVDMAGNVVEWCLTEYESSDNRPYRMTANRSWLATGIRDFRVDYHNYAEAYLRGNMFSFRIVRAYDALS